MSNERLYKGKFIIAFYEKDDETLYDVFSNTREVTIAVGLEPTRDNVIWISHKLVRAFRKKTHYIDIFGRLMKAYPVNVVDEISDSEYLLDNHIEQQAKEEQQNG